jgi:predicted dehydrogenase
MKLGFIGAGFIARFQSIAISQVRGLEVAGILNRRGAEALADFCRKQRVGDAKIYGSIAELARNVDVVAVYVPNYCRVEVMEEIASAVKSGAKLKGVIVDKPLARNMKEARRKISRPA